MKKIQYKQTFKPISKLSDLNGLTVIVRVWDEEDINYDEVLAVVDYCHIEDYYFYEKWGEPMYLRIKLNPIKDLNYYNDFKIFDIEFFNEYFNLSDIINIVEIL
jgi:hypothetical protein